MSSIVTYGGGEILYHVFNAISMLVGGKSGYIFAPLVTIGATFGFLWVVASSFYESAMEGIPRNWLLPVLMMYGLILVPTTTVHIKDPILRHNSSATTAKDWSCVDNIPLGLAMFAQTISSIGHTLTNAIEKCFSMPDDALHNKTGHIFGAENILDMRRYAITDPILSQNMFHFVTQCIAFDLSLGLYDVNDLKKSTDIWGLVKDRTSRVRSFKYRDPAQKRCSLKTCREGAAAMNDALTNEKSKFNKSEIFKHLPFAFAALTGKASVAQDLITQQIMMHTIMDSLDKKAESLGSYAGSRAAAYQRQTYQVAGELAGKSIVVLRTIIEALIYASFIFIIPMLLMPMGFRVLLTWIGLNLWIQLWPPFYAILNFIMTICMQMQTNKLLAMVDTDQIGLSIYTSVGLMDMANDMQAIAGYLALSIPFISYAIVKGGVSSFVHLSSSMMSPVHAAASASAQESVTGNYAYGNVQMDSQSYSAQHMLTRQSAPHLSSGYYRESTGRSEMVVGQDGAILNESVSNLPVDIQGSSSISSSLRRQSQDMLSQGESKRSAASENYASSMRALSDFTHHMSNNRAYDTAISENTGTSMSKVASDTLKKAEQWGKKYGFDTSQSATILGAASASLGVNNTGILSASLSGKLQGVSEAKRNEIMDSATSFAKDSGISENFQEVLSFAQDKRSAEHDDTGKRLSDSVSTLYDRGQSYQEQADRYQQLYSSYSSLADYAENNSVSVNQKYNQEFVDYAVKYTGSPTKALHVMHNRPEEFKTLLSNFVHQKERSMLSSINHYDLTTESGYKKAQDTLSQSYTPMDNSIAQPHKPWVKESSHMADAKKQISDNLVAAQDAVAEKIDDTKQIHYEKDVYAQDIDDSKSEWKVKHALKNVWK